MKYVDSNVLILAVVDAGSKGNCARTLLDHALKNREPIGTSVLTLDEVAWKIKQYRGLRQAASICRKYLNTSGIHFASVTPDIMKKALDFMETLNTDPRDSIHAATAIAMEAEAIVTDDADFEKFQNVNLKRIKLSQ